MVTGVGCRSQRDGDVLDLEGAITLVAHPNRHKYENI